MAVLTGQRSEGPEPPGPACLTRHRRTTSDRAQRIRTPRRAARSTTIPAKDAEDPRVAAGTMTPGNPTVPWIVWDEGTAAAPNNNDVFVARLVGAGAAARFVIANGGQPIGTGDRADITFSGNTPYVTWHHDGSVVTDTSPPLTRSSRTMLRSARARPTRFVPRSPRDASPIGSATTALRARHTRSERRSSCSPTATRSCSPTPTRPTIS